MVQDTERYCTLAISYPERDEGSRCVDEAMHDEDEPTDVSMLYGSYTISTRSNPSRNSAGLDPSRNSAKERKVKPNDTEKDAKRCKRNRKAVTQQRASTVC